jgi:hypothetical protein
MALTDDEITGLLDRALRRGDDDDES